MKRDHIIQIHAIFWAVTLVSIGLQAIPSIGNKTWDVIALDFIIYIISFVSFFYLFYFFISAKHLDRKRVILLIISGLLFTMIITIPVTYIYLHLLFPNVMGMTGRRFFLNFGKNYISFFETNFMFALSGSLIKIAFLWYNNTMKQKEAEKQLISVELALLRSQVNPRFLLNTLSFIRSLIERSPEKAIYSIENLSEIMSYMLYETSAGKVPLNNEINYINNYLKLLEVRYVTGYIELQISGDMNGIMVPPLLYMPFLEYAFSSAEPVDDCPEIPGIIIKLAVTASTLLFEVTKYARENVMQIEDDNSISLSSIKRFLDLQLGSNYTLEKLEEKNKITISIKLNLAA